MPELYYHKKKLTYKATLQSANYANYFNYYHLGEYNDPFYKIIANEINALLCKTKLEIHELKVPTKEGFHFKNEYTTYLLADGTPCMPDAAINKDVLIYMTILPYDFVDQKNIRRAGLSITANQIRIVKTQT